MFFDGYDLLGPRQAEAIKMPFSLDPESMRGKLFLLFADKIIIGAILAFAFLIYDNWKTEEVREYNEVIQDAQDDFRRAEFIKELLPIVLDTEQSVQTRIEVLGSLIRTESLDPNSAIMISLSMLREGSFVLADGGIPNDELVGSFVRMLGPIIPDVLPQVLDAYGYYPSISEAPAGYASALIRTFEFAWRNYPTERLGILNDPSFVADHLDLIVKILPQAHEQYNEWNGASPLALKLIRDIQTVETARDEDEAVHMARERLSEILRRTSGDEAEIRLSTALFFELSGSISDEQFIRDSFKIIMQPERVSEAVDSLVREKRRDPFYHQFTSATEFLLNASAVNPQAEALAIPVVEELLAKLQASDIEFGNYPIERTMVCVLVRSMSLTGPQNKRSDRADELLASLAELPGEKLRAANLGFLIRDPIASLPAGIRARVEAASPEERSRLVAEGEFRAFEACGVDLDQYR